MPKAKNLKYCRKKAGLTQQALADNLGVSKATVVSWEARRTAIPVPSTKKIAAYFGVAYEAFCDTDLERLDRKVTAEDIRLSDSEAENLMLFRELPDKVKDMFRYMVKQAHKMEVELSRTGEK